MTLHGKTVAEICFLKTLNLKFQNNLEVPGYNSLLVNRKNDVLAKLTNFNPEEFQNN